MDYSEEYLGLNKPINQIEPLLSVRLLTFNHKDYIQQALESVLTQKTNFLFEIVIGEDDSTDGTRDICKNYAEKYPDKTRLILRSEQNKIFIKGIKTSRFNFAETIKACRGKYIAMLDGDDYWTDEHKLQKQVDFLESNSDVVLTGHSVIFFNKNKHLSTPTLSPLQKGISENDIKSLDGLPTSTMCFRNIVDDFPPEFYNVTNGDIFLASLLGQYGKRLFMPGIEPSMYRIHSDSMWTPLSVANKIMLMKNTYDQMADYYKRLNQEKFVLYYARVTSGYNHILSNKLHLYWFVFRSRSIYYFNKFPVALKVSIHRLIGSLKRFGK